MPWALGVAVLILVGFGLGRILYFEPSPEVDLSPLDPLGPERESLYQPVALEVETQISILAVSLNEVFEENKQGHSELACHLISLSESEWRRLAEQVLALHELMLRYLPLLGFVVPLRSVTPRHFRSAIMLEQVRTREALNQFVFRPRLRFHLHLGVLRGAGQTLTREFCRAGSQARQTPESLLAHWNLLDLYFYDFDLVAKESLLALRVLLAGLPDSALSEFECDLGAATRREVHRSPVLPLP